MIQTGEEGEVEILDLVLKFLLEKAPETQKLFVLLKVVNPVNLFVVAVVGVVGIILVIVLAVVIGVIIGGAAAA